MVSMASSVTRIYFPLRFTASRVVRQQLQQNSRTQDALTFVSALSRKNQPLCLICSVVYCWRASGILRVLSRYKFLEFANARYFSSQYQFANFIESFAGSSWSAFSCCVKFFSRHEESCIRSMMDWEESPLLRLPVALPLPFLCEADILKNRKPGNV